MKKYIFPKDYPELDLQKMKIILYEAAPALLSVMSANASALSKKYLEKMGIIVKTNIRVLDYDGNTVTLSDNSTFETKTLIWTAGVKASSLKGLKTESFGPGGRLLVNRTNQLIGHSNIFTIGDLCLMHTEKYPKGHPQLAQVAIQQANLLAANLKRLARNDAMLLFEYKNKGSMATVGRNLAVADMPGFKLSGFVAWALWSFVHLFSIMGIKNRLSIFLNWTWNYFTYDQSLRLLIKPKTKPVMESISDKHKLVLKPELYEN
jgi:NADH dehydrogenase